MIERVERRGVEEATLEGGKEVAGMRGGSKGGRVHHPKVGGPRWATSHVPPTKGAAMGRDGSRHRVPP